ncbi:protein phosphatase 2C domain-containing protein [Actinoplanes sp. KI2]|uniref:protein phosphatase 2C domain-containing protein n=1 Tax=Actinoplanes sp. KI2 TaxID=2983315 RepID=UPI0021D5DBEE|nr:protein phosphatase 2C domain-containing protein [Actinoplanes sp. KI2]MCU7727006.1 protein phosphatase 2C domain-containing protein [Actinoplanes sp. KI2]
MTGSEATSTTAPELAAPGWFQHANGRWVVEDAGRQPEVTPVPAAGRAGTRPDTIVDGGRLGGLAYRATSQRGLAHQEVGVPRQDAYLVRPTPDRRWLVGCVADGVSAGKLSHEAADLVCQETTVRLARGLIDLAAEPEAAGPGAARAAESGAAWAAAAEALPWQDIVRAANASIRDAAMAAVRDGLGRSGDQAGLVELENSWDDASARTVMSSTAVLFAVAAQPVADGGHPAVVAVVAGDSTALLLDGDDWTPLAAVKNDGAEIASTAVRSLPGPVRVQPQARMLRPGQALVVITDGLGDPLGSGGGVVGRFLATMWRRPPDLLAYAGHVGFYRRSFNDDRTAVTIWVAEP